MHPKWGYVHVRGARTVEVARMEPLDMNRKHGWIIEFLCTFKLMSIYRENVGIFGRRTCEYFCRCAHSKKNPKYYWIIIHQKSFYYESFFNTQWLHKRFHIKSFLFIAFLKIQNKAYNSFFEHFNEFWFLLECFWNELCISVPSRLTLNC